MRPSTVVLSENFIMITDEWMGVTVICQEREKQRGKLASLRVACVQSGQLGEMSVDVVSLRPIEQKVKNPLSH